MSCDNLTLNDTNIKLCGSQVNVSIQTDTNTATSIMVLQRCENPKIFIAWSGQIPSVSIATIL